MPLEPLSPLGFSDVAERPHWTITKGQATFAPVPGGWRAVVSALSADFHTTFSTLGIARLVW